MKKKSLLSPVNVASNGHLELLVGSVPSRGWLVTSSSSGTGHILVFNKNENDTNVTLVNFHSNPEFLKIYIKTNLPDFQIPCTKLLGVVSENVEKNIALQYTSKVLHRHFMQSSFFVFV